MNEVERLARQVDLAYRDGSWGGGSIRELFRSMSAVGAAAHPVPDAHSVWEIALHLTLWHDAFRRRLAGEAVDYENDADWPAPREATEPNWQATLEALDRSHEALVAAIRDVRLEQLDELAPQRPFTVYVMLHGVTQHDHYHAGQVMILRKALRYGSLPGEA
jgi:uncharacterized damage-inducible protein DinB